MPSVLFVSRLESVNIAKNSTHFHFEFSGTDLIPCEDLQLAITRCNPETNQSIVQLFRLSDFDGGVRVRGSVLLAVIDGVSVSDELTVTLAQNGQVGATWQRFPIVRNTTSDSSPARGSSTDSWVIPLIVVAVLFGCALVAGGVFVLFLSHSLKRRVRSLDAQPGRHPFSLMSSTPPATPLKDQSG
jgi:hypothetical protein